MPERHGAVIFFRIDAPGATRVALVGSFNKWDPAANPLTTRDGRLWETAVTPGPGRHSYCFLVDDRPVPPPLAPLYEDDGFGGRNGVLEVP
jgi:1,4-alpha-glucan branching enzyme